MVLLINIGWLEVTEKENNNSSSNKISRRDILKGFATAPILGIFAYDFWKRKAMSKLKQKAIQTELGLNGESPAVLPKTTKKESGEFGKFVVCRPDSGLPIVKTHWRLEFEQEEAEMAEI